jgi:outer membrane protein assembly factor BamB
MDVRAHVKKLVALSVVFVIISITLFWYFFVNQSSGYEHRFLWRQEVVFGLDNFGTATYKDGVLYAPSKGNNMVYALNATTGAIIWNRQVRQCDGSPCIDGDMLFVGECSGPNGEATPAPRACALNRSSGEVIWAFVEPSNVPWVGSPVVSGDFIYYTTLGTGVYALNKSNGTPIWNQTIGKIVCSIAYHNGVVFVSANDPPGQYAFNATTGEIVWHVNYGSSWDSSPVVYEGIVIQVTGNKPTDFVSTCLFNETNGQLIRKFEGNGGQSTPLVHDDKIFIPSQNCRIYAYDLESGTELWHTAQLTTSHPNLKRPDLTYCSPASANGTIYYQSLSGTFYAIDETTGNIRWFSQLDGYGFGSPSIGNGHVYITNDLALYAFEIDNPNGDWPMFCQNNLHQSYVG